FTERYAEGGTSRSELAAAPVGEEDEDAVPCLWIESAGDASRLAAGWAAQDVRAAIWRAATGPRREAQEAAEAASAPHPSCGAAKSTELILPSTLPPLPPHPPSPPPPSPPPLPHTNHRRSLAVRVRPPPRR